MRKLNSACNLQPSSYKREKASNTQDSCFRENVQLLLEVEVIESLYAAMSREKENSVKQSGVVEVTIIRPETMNNFTQSPQNSGILNTIEEQTKKRCSGLQYSTKTDRKLTSSATNRRSILNLDDRQNKSFVFENRNEGPTINIAEIVGDNLPSRVTVKPRITLPENNPINGSLKVHHGDNCEPEILMTENDGKTFAADPLKAYVNLSYNSESKMRKTQSCANPLVYQVRLETGAQPIYPLVELSAAKKILDSYAPDESSRCELKHQIIESMRKTLKEWGSDKKRITDALDDTSPFTRCEHCGVISLKKFNNLSQEIGNYEKCLATENTDENAYGKISRNEIKENTPQLKSSTSSGGNKATKESIELKKTGIEKAPEDSLGTKFDSLYRELNSKLFMRELELKGENINAGSAVDTMTAERDRDFISENIMKMTDGSRKNKWKLCSSMEKNENSNDPRFKNSYSTRYSQRQIITKPVKKPTVNNSTRNNFETDNNGTRFRQKNSTTIRSECNGKEASVFENGNKDNTNSKDKPPLARTNAKDQYKTSLMRGSLRKNKFGRSLVPPSNTPTKLGKTNSIELLSSKNEVNYSAREKRSTIEIKGRELLEIDEEPSSRHKGDQSLVSSNSNESETQSKPDLGLWTNQTLLEEGIDERFENQCPDSNNLMRNFLHHCIASSDNNSSTDQTVCAGNSQLSNSDIDQRSFCSTKNFKLNQIIPDFNRSTPLIGFKREIFGNNNLAENNLPAQYNGESETTAFSSSSSENVTREWAFSLAQVPKVDCKPLEIKKNDESIRIDKAFEKSANYPVVTEETVYSHEVLGKYDNSSKLCGDNVLPNADYIPKQYERSKKTNCHHFSVDETVPWTDAAQPVLLRLENNSKKLILTHDPSKTTSAFAKNTFNVAEKTLNEESENPTLQKNLNISEEMYFKEQKYVAIRKPVRKVFEKLMKNTLKMTYKNLASVISSSSEYSSEDHREFDVQKRSVDNKGKDRSVLQLNESETFEREITYDEISLKDNSAASKENLKTRALPVYRKILESKDQMDWESFQQLVATLHPSQRELWCDICKAVSNEAKRVAGETGAATEVCIEINPVPASQVFFPCEEGSTVKRLSSGNEVSFEMDMILTGSETFLDHKFHDSQKTLHDSEKCQ